MNGRFWIVSGILFAAVGGAVSAVGAVSAIGVLAQYGFGLSQYIAFHAFALIVTGLLAERRQSPWIGRAGVAFLVSAGFYCGGFLLFALTYAEPFAELMPLGGLAWVAGCLMLGAGVMATKPEAT